MRPVQKPPCFRCPKFKLYPNPFNPGLDPRNVLAVQIYRLAAQDVRAGEGAILISTVNIRDTIAVMDEYAEHLPTALARQETLELVRVLDRVAMKVRGPIEEEARKQSMERVKQEAQHKNRNMRSKR